MIHTRYLVILVDVYIYILVTYNIHVTFIFIYILLLATVLGLLSFIFLKKKKTTDCRHRLMAHSHGDTIIIHYSPLRSCILVNAATTVTTVTPVTTTLQIFCLQLIHTNGSRFIM